MFNEVDQFYRWQRRQTLRERAVIWVLLSSGALTLTLTASLIGFSTQLEKFARVSGALIGGCLCGVATAKSYRLVDGADERLAADMARIDLCAWKHAKLFELATEPQVQGADPVALLPEAVQFFDWQLFNTDPNKWPHLAIIGGTGDGKSYTTEWAMDWLDGIAIVCHPHKKPTDYPNIQTVYCGGRNYGNWRQDPPVDFQQLLAGTAGTVSFASFIKTLEVEMDRRYKLYEQGIEDYPMINVVLDELNTSLSKVPGAIEIIKNLWREARKVKIRLLCLLQTDNVKALKLEGEGALRQCLKYVRLGSFAKAHASRIGNEVIVNWVKGQKYPIMVEDMPAKITQMPPGNKPIWVPSSKPQAQSQTYSLDLSALVRVPIADARLLPARPGVYFVIDSSFKPHYIGSSSNIMLRWNSQFGEHDRLAYFEDLEAFGVSVLIATYPCSTYQDEEDRLIAEFRPYLNGTPISTRPEQMRAYWDSSYRFATHNHHTITPEVGVQTPPHTNSAHKLTPLLHQGSTTFTPSHQPIPEGWIYPDPHQEPSGVVRGVIVACINAGWGQTRTIQAVWGVSRGGRNPNYDAARNWYQQIIQEAGLN